jgi:hypothetical protein
MINPKLLAGSLPGLNLRLRFRGSAHRRRVNRRLQVAAEFTLLEDRCLMSGVHVASHKVKLANQTTIYVASKQSTGTLIGPYTLQNPAANPGNVIFMGGTSPNTPGVDWGNVPMKLVTFTNNSSNQQTIYPFLYSPNNSQLYDPIDKPNDEYREYIGYEQGGKDILGLPYGQSITISVPLVFWNGGRADIATGAANLLPKPAQVTTLNPYNFRYKATTYITSQGVTSSTDNGIVMYYKANTPGAPVNPSPAAAGQLTEWTIRDKNFLTMISNYDTQNNLGTIAPSELTNLINYDVSYVDDMLAPIAMEATSVPVPIQYIQSGTATQNGTTTTIEQDDSGQYAALNELLTSTYPYTTYTWLVKYNVPGSTNPIELGTVTNISNGIITVVNNGSVAALPTGQAAYVFYTNDVTANYGWTGANNDIVAMQSAMATFTTPNPQGENVNGLGQYFGGLGWPEYYNPNSGALTKIPSGANILVNSPLTDSRSPYDNLHYLLTSGTGGQQIQYDTNATAIMSDQKFKAGSTVTFAVNMSTKQLIAMQNAINNGNATWNVIGANYKNATIATIQKADQIDPAKQTITVELSQDITYLSSGYSLTFKIPPSDPYVSKLTNLWYSWANYYVNQLSNVPTQNISATVSADKDSKADTRLLTLGTAQPQLAVGMTVTGQGISGLTTILRIATVNNLETLYLSAPVPQALNGQTVAFTFSKPQPIQFGDDPGLQTNLINPGGFGQDASFATAFAASVYELMSVYSTIPAKQTNLPYRSMDLVYEAIGGNVGFLPTAAYTQISSDVRDVGKSVLRGVPDFGVYKDQHTTDAEWTPGAWYPPPSTPTDGTDYNVYNLDPFVWFVHQKLGLSGYGFSFDDDVSDVGAGGANALTITYAPSAQVLPVQSQWFPSTPWGTVTAMATISNYGNNSMLTLQPQSAAAFWQVNADDPNNALVGAYVSTTAPGIAIPQGTNLLASLDSNQLQFELSTQVTATTTPVLITLTGYEP